MRQIVNRCEPSLRTSVKEFLDLQSKAPPEAKHCAECGSTCAHMRAQFWLDGDEEAFRVWLPYCPQCNPELASRGVRGCPDELESAERFL